MSTKHPAGPVPAIVADGDLIRVGGYILRLSAICYATPVAGGIILYLNNGRLFISEAGGGKDLADWLQQESSPLLRTE